MFVWHISSAPWKFANRVLIVFVGITHSLSSTASCDVGFAIYFRYAVDSPSGPTVSYVAHLTGALAGLTIGLLVLKNFEQKLHEQLVWWIALGVYAACTVFAIVYNVMNTVAAQRFEESEEVMRQQLFYDLGIWTRRHRVVASIVNTSIGYDDHENNTFVLMIGAFERKHIAE